MSKEKEVKNESSKVMTKYERKQAARLAQQKKDEQSAKITKAVAFVVCICVVVAIAYSIANPIIKRQKAVYDTYVKIGEHEVLVKVCQLKKLQKKVLTPKLSTCFEDDPNF